jgi:aldehyde dehydrogenase (NAD+)
VLSPALFSFVKWLTCSSLYISWNHGQACCAGSRIFVHAKIYDQFLAGFTAKAKSLKIGDPFEEGAYQGPQISQIQYDRIMGYIKSGKDDGATVHLGGDRFGTEGYFINPTIFTDCKPEMKIVKEEIFGPVGVIIKFEDDEGVSTAVFVEMICATMTDFGEPCRCHSSGERYDLRTRSRDLQP